MAEAVVAPPCVARSPPSKARLPSDFFAEWRAEAMHNVHVNVKTGSSVPLTSVSRQRFDRSDRMLHRSEFEVLQALTGKQFTWDACASNDGSNAHCPRFSSPKLSFLRDNCAGHHVWFNPPFDRVQEFLQHYLACKALAPARTSAGFLLPKWASARWRPLLAGMRKLHEYPAGYHLFSAPAGRGKRRRMAGTPWPVEFWYDPPAAAAPAEPPCAVDVLPFSVAKGLAMQFEATVDRQAARVLIDTGCQGAHFLSADFCRKAGIPFVPPSGDAATLRVTVGDGRSCPVLGLANVPVHIQGYKATLQCAVMEMAPRYDLILGEPWIKATGAWLDLCSHCAVLSIPKRVVLRSDPFTKVPRAPRKAWDDSQWSGEQLLAAVGAYQVEECFVALVRETYPDLPAPVVTPSPCMSALLCQVGVAPDPSAPAVPSNKEPVTWQEQVKRAVPGESAAELGLRACLLQRAHLFPPSLPGLPPDRGIPEVIPLLPDARPPAPRLFRYSPTEVDEMRRQVTDLLEKGLIQPSCSPFGAPVLFAKKKDGTLRMCLDYRALNRVTVRNSYPLPRIDDLIDRLSGSKVFSSLDLLSGYHQLLLRESDVPKSAFRTPFGSFEWKVLSFGLTNAPSVFQSAMNRMLADLPFVVVYLDDILIHSRTPEEHVEHVRVVLDRLAANKYYCKLSKCEFFKPAVPFLGHIVTAAGVQVDPRKTAVVQQWPVPQSIDELRSFLGFANYFRKFIRAYAGITLPLVRLLSSKVKWCWDDECQKAFDAVKHALTTTPVLAIPDPSVRFEVVCDASDYALGAVLLQNGRPIAFESRKLIPAERNYTVTEREHLAIVHALKTWRCYLEGPEFTVFTDHNPLTFYPRQALLSRRVARWLEFLERFRMRWEYRPGRSNMADPLSRPPSEHAACCIVSIASVSAQPEGASSEPISSFPAFEQMVRSGYETDPWFAEPANTASLEKRYGMWWRGSCLVLPDDPALRTAALRECHDNPLAGHTGVQKTLELVQRFFWWPGMRKHVAGYVRSCDSCQRVKASQQAPAGLLHPLPVPEVKWHTVTMDFVTDLPPSKHPVSGAVHDSIMVVCDKLSKMVHLAPCCKDMDAKAAAHLFFERVVSLHGFPRVLVHDRDPKFTSDFFASLCAINNMAQAMTSSYHPQSDGQTERANRVIEDMLRHYVCPDTQSDWVDFLPMVEFAYNNAFHSSLGSTPFRLNYGFDPLTPMSILTRSRGGKEAWEAYRELLARHKNMLARQFSVRMQEALQRARRCLEAARQRQKEWADKKRRHVEFEKGSLVLLSTKNVKLKSSGSRKLLPRFIGPFTVTRQVNPVAYEIDLPTQVRLHNVFHVSLLRPYVHDGVTPVPPMPDIIDGELEREVERIIKHRARKGSTVRKEFLIRWAGLGEAYDTWEPEEHLTNCPDVLREYWAGLASSDSSREPHASVTPTTTRSGRLTRTPARYMALLHSLAVHG